MKKKNLVFILVFLVILLFAIDYNLIDNLLIQTFNGIDSESGLVERVIDGDTIIVESQAVRLLGINAPERNEKYYEESKKYLESLVLGKEVNLKFTKKKYDKYSRKLAYVYSEGENINLKLVEKGLANFYFPEERDNNYETFRKAWEDCIEENVNLCEKSNDSCRKCIVFSGLDSIKNICEYDCNISRWIVKGEGRRKFVFEKSILKKNQEEFFNLELNPQDTLFLRDNFWKLVKWKNVIKGQ